MKGLFCVEEEQFYESSESFDAIPRFCATTTQIGAVGLEEGANFAYTFDFGSEERHFVRVKSVRPATAGEVTDGAKGSVVASVGTAPPQYPSDEDGH